MNRRLLCALCATLLASLARPPPVAAGDVPEIIELRSLASPVTVMVPDRVARTLKVRTGDGRVLTVQVPAQIREFERVEAGERINLDYQELFALVVRKVYVVPDGPGGRTINWATTVPADVRSGVALKSADLVAVVTDIDHVRRALTLRIPEHGTRAFKVSDTMLRFVELRQGDEVVLQHREAMALAVKR